MSNILASHFFCHIYLETPHRPFYINTRLISQHLKLRLSPMKIHGPTPQTTRSRSAAQAAEIPGALRQSVGFLLALMADVIHHPTLYHNNTSAYDIPTSNIIIRRKSIIPSGIKMQNPHLLHLHSRCFGSYFDVTFLMYIVSSGFSFKPSSLSSSSTQFSQEWLCRKVNNQNKKPSYFKLDRIYIHSISKFLFCYSPYEYNLVMILVPVC